MSNATWWMENVFLILAVWLLSFGDTSVFVLGSLVVFCTRVILRKLDMISAKLDKGTEEKAETDPEAI